MSKFWPFLCVEINQIWPYNQTKPILTFKNQTSDVKKLKFRPNWQNFDEILAIKLTWSRNFGIFWQMSVKTIAAWNHQRNLLFGTVNQLIFIGSFVTILDAPILPQDFRVVVKLLQRKFKKFKKSKKKKEKKMKIVLMPLIDY